MTTEERLTLDDMMQIMLLIVAEISILDAGIAAAKKSGSKDKEKELSEDREWMMGLVGRHRAEVRHMMSQGHKLQLDA